MWIRVRLPVVGLRHFVCRIARIVCERYNELNFCAFGSVSFTAEPFGDQKTANVTFGEVTILVSLTGRAALR
jgi:hypothetical protein